MKKVLDIDKEISYNLKHKLSEPGSANFQARCHGETCAKGNHTMTTEGRGARPHSNTG